MTNFLTGVLSGFVASSLTAFAIIRKNIKSNKETTTKELVIPIMTSAILAGVLLNILR